MKKLYDNHGIILYQGDCVEVMNKLVTQGIVANAIITDPPYGYLKHKIETNIDFDELYDIYNKITNKDAFIGFCGKLPHSFNQIGSAMKLWKFYQEFIWYKRKGVSPVEEIKQMHESLYFFRKGNAKINKEFRMPWADYAYKSYLYGNISAKNNVNALISFFKNINNVRDILAYLEKGRNYISTTKLNGYTLKSEMGDLKSAVSTYRTVVDKGIKPQSIISFVSHNKLKHPTVKPIMLMEYFIGLFTLKDELVIEPFAGTGTTGLACLAKNRKCIMIEKYPEYCDIILKRLNAYDNRQLGVNDFFDFDVYDGGVEEENKILAITK